MIRIFLLDSNIKVKWPIKQCLDWQSLAHYDPWYHAFLTCFGHLGWRNIRDRIVSIFCRVTQGGQGKCSFMSLLPSVLLTSFANVNNQFECLLGLVLFIYFLFHRYLRKYDSSRHIRLQKIHFNNSKC